VLHLLLSPHISSSFELAIAVLYNKSLQVRNNRIFFEFYLLAVLDQRRTSIGRISSGPSSDFGNLFRLLLDLNIISISFWDFCTESVLFLCRRKRSRKWKCLSRFFKCLVCQNVRDLSMFFRIKRRRANLSWKIHSFYLVAFLFAFWSGETMNFD